MDKAEPEPTYEENESISPPVVKGRCTGSTVQICIERELKNK